MGGGREEGRQGITSFLYSARSAALVGSALCVASHCACTCAPRRRSLSTGPGELWCAGLAAAAPGRHFHRRHDRSAAPQGAGDCTGRS